jgi:uncharacterized membrane protein YkvA (DUF1232 family)
MKEFVQSWKRRARELKVEVYAIYLAYKDPRVPWYARIFAACVVGYAFSPIDLIPDPIPVLGYLDDLVLVPLGVVECRERAQEIIRQGKPVSKAAAVIIVLIWLALAAIVLLWLARTFQR